MKEMKKRKVYWIDNRFIENKIFLGVGQADIDFPGPCAPAKKPNYNLASTLKQLEEIKEMENKKMENKRSRENENDIDNENGNVNDESSHFRERKIKKQKTEKDDDKLFPPLPSTYSNIDNIDNVDSIFGFELVNNDEFAIDDSSNDNDNVIDSNNDNDIDSNNINIDSNNINDNNIDIFNDNGFDISNNSEDDLLTFLLQDDFVIPNDIPIPNILDLATYNFGTIIEPIEPFQFQQFFCQPFQTQSFEETLPFEMVDMSYLNNIGQMEIMNYDTTNMGTMGTMGTIPDYGIGGTLDTNASFLTALGMSLSNDAKLENARMNTGMDMKFDMGLDMEFDMGLDMGMDTGIINWI
jgi:hypothetical protein